MKKLFTALNILSVIASVAVTVIYYFFYGGIVMKGVTSFMFVVVGLINLIYSFVMKTRGKGFILLINSALIVCMAADIILNIDFIIGALVFAVGHVLYSAAYCVFKRFKIKDFIPIGAMFVISLIILLLPVYDYGSDLMFIIVLIYGLIISCMVGKSVSNFLREKGRVQIMLLIGSVVFYLSDLMLLLNIFADAPKITSFLCCFLYWPGQTLLAHTLFHYIESRSK